MNGKSDLPDHYLGRRYIPSMYMHERLHPAIPRKGIQNLVVYCASNDFWKRITRRSELGVPPNPKHLCPTGRTNIKI